MDGADEGLGEEGGPEGVEPAEARPVMGATAGDVAGADDEVGVVVDQAVDHGGDGIRGVGEVGIHDDEEFVVGDGQAGEDGGREAAVGGADEGAALGELVGKFGEHRGSGIGGVVIDDDDFPGPATGRHGGGDGGDEQGQIFGFAEGGNDDTDAWVHGELDTGCCDW